MLDLSHIPNSQQDIQIFYANGTAWQTWRKPRKCSYVWIMCIGGGSGGGGGQGPFDTVGGNGGGSGAVARALINSQQLPDILYVQVGRGGAGGANLTNGSAGTRSWVSLLPVTSIIAQNIVLGSGGGVGAGGTTGTGLASAGESAITTSSASFATLSNFISTAGRPSTAFDGFSDWLPNNPLTSSIVCPGAGANLGGTYGSILATSISPLIPAGANGVGGNGGNGITSWKPFYSLGGAGGGNATSGNGGNGGNGGIGSGGGGGGSATGGTPGKGGDGGDGLVVIISF